MTSADALSPASQSENRCHFFYCISAAAHQLIRCITAVARGLPLSHVAHLLPHGGRSKRHSGVAYPLSLEPSLPTGLFRSESGRQPSKKHYPTQRLRRLHDTSAEERATTDSSARENLLFSHQIRGMRNMTLALAPMPSYRFGGAISLGEIFPSQRHSFGMFFRRYLSRAEARDGANWPKFLSALSELHALRCCCAICSIAKLAQKKERLCRCRRKKATESKLLTGRRKNHVSHLDLAMEGKEGTKAEAVAAVARAKMQEDFIVCA